MKPFTAVFLTIGVLPFVRAEDWPMWGRDQTRNMASLEKNPPIDFQFEIKLDGKLVKAAKNIKWSAPLGFQTVGSPIVADGLVWIGTNNMTSKDGGQERMLNICTIPLKRETPAK